MGRVWTRHIDTNGLIKMQAADLAPSRGACEFGNCRCAMYVGSRDGTCITCGHGDCWHEAKVIDRRFVSTRNPARQPRYAYERMDCPE